jgi:hypothetical protein
MRSSGRAVVLYGTEVPGRTTAATYNTQWYNGYYAQTYMYYLYTGMELN